MPARKLHSPLKDNGLRDCRSGSGATSRSGDFITNAPVSNAKSQQKSYELVFRTLPEKKSVASSASSPS